MGECTQFITNLAAWRDCALRATARDAPHVLSSLLQRYGAPNPLPVCPPGSQVCARVVTRSYRDADGRQYLDVSIPSASGWSTKTICTANCGAGTGFFGLGGTAADIGRAVASITGRIALAASGIGAFYTAGEALSQNVERSQKGMSLNIGGILSSVGGVLSGANLGDYSFLGQLGGAGLNIAGAALTPQPSYVAASPMYGPVYSPPPMQAPPPVQQTASVFPLVGAAAGRMAAITAPILAKIAVKLGLRARPSLTRAMDLVRKAAKVLQSPEAVAVALGISVAELATIVTTSNARKRRRMNPANSKALRRAARRIKSFHRLCTHTDVLRGRSRARSVGASCGTCKKRPCRC